MIHQSYLSYTPRWYPVGYSGDEYNQVRVVGNASEGYSLRPLGLGPTPPAICSSTPRANGRTREGAVTPEPGARRCG